MPTATGRVWSGAGTFAAIIACACGSTGHGGTSAAHTELVSIRTSDGTIIVFDSHDGGNFDRQFHVSKSDLAGVQWRARPHGNAGIHGNVGNVDSVTSRI